jgi:hypothetical protein
VPKVDIAAPRIGNGAVRIWLYAGNSEDPALLVATCDSDNATGADNQQGSPRDPSETIRRTSGCRMMRWSPLHGDMQGWREQGRATRFRSPEVSSKRNSLSGKFRPARMA